VQIGDITPVNILLNWTVLNQSNSFDTGNDTIRYYLLQWTKQGSSTPVTLVNVSASTTNGQYNVTWANGWVLNTYYDIIVTAVNDVGYGYSSIPLTILTDNVPTYMYTPVEDPTTNATFINVTWQSLVDPTYTGRDPIIYYNLQWDQGNSTWQWLTTPNISVNYFTMNNTVWPFNNGSSYRFKVWPLNRAGYGASSLSIGIIPSSPPD